jgi:predicted acylesterase/phospholipase RssA
MIHTKVSQNQIGLALSGGGVRTIAFHTGLLRWLAENNLFEKADV